MKETNLKSNGNCKREVVVNTWIENDMIPMCDAVTKNIENKFDEVDYIKNFIIKQTNNFLLNDDDISKLNDRKWSEIALPYFINNVETFMKLILDRDLFDEDRELLFNLYSKALNIILFN